METLRPHLVHNGSSVTVHSVWRQRTRGGDGDGERHERREHSDPDEDLSLVTDPHHTARRPSHSFVIRLFLTDEMMTSLYHLSAGLEAHQFTSFYRLFISSVTELT
ncbi:hypothetical protein GOODEAATRI_032094 [Goodea atripinnis]|uniref:Uncharacterized protein n=1 Tax=Goodea atripinnis TaxID=208336 RepID=A0ABV0PIR8_9TELE